MMQPKDDDALDATTLDRIRRAMDASPPPPLSPPEGLWTSVADELALTTPATTPAPAPEPRMSRRALLASFLVGGALGAATTYALTRPSEPEERTLIREVPLTPVDDVDDIRGTARLITLDDATLLEVTVDEPLTNGPDDYVEVWLINEDLKRMVTVGVFPPGSQVRLPVTTDLIADGYTIVDLSREEFDTEPGHSGNTIVRSSASL